MVVMATRLRGCIYLGRAKQRVLECPLQMTIGWITVHGDENDVVGLTDRQTSVYLSVAEKLVNVVIVPFLILAVLVTRVHFDHSMSTISVQAESGRYQVMAL